MTGVLALTRLALRRSRLLLSVWVLALTAVCYASAAATATLYPSAAERVAAAHTINVSPALVALYGPILDPHSLGELAMTKMTVTYAVFVMALAVVLVRRHLRAEEESGRAELLGGTAVGRDSLLAAAVLTGVIASALCGVLAAAADVAGGLPAAGSLWFGASWLGIGLVGTGLAAVACQASASARTCGALAAGGVGVLFLARALGDTGPRWLSWLSPLGWSTRLQAWTDPRWLLLIADVVVAAGLVMLATLLRARRDLGSGLVAARPGPATAPPRLRDALALTLRVQATGLAVWSVAVATGGLLMAAVVPSVGSMLDSGVAREAVERLGGVGRLQDSLVAALVSVLAVVVTAYAVGVAGHAGAEERDGRTEQVLASATSRDTAYAAVVAVALGGATLLLAVLGLAFGIGLGDLASSLRAVAAQAPAVWLVSSLALLCLALSGRRAGVGWAVLGFVVLDGQLAALLHLPGWAAGLSPYSHVPMVPAEAWSWPPELVLTALTVAVLATARWRYGRRDIG